MMKKIFFMAACIMFVSTAAFAATSVSITLTDKTTTGLSLFADGTAGAATTGGQLIGKSSTGVGVGVLTNALGYSMVTQHLNGSKAYATSYDSTSIFSEDVATIGTPLLAVPKATDTSDFASWSAL